MVDGLRPVAVVDSKEHGGQTSPHSVLEPPTDRPVAMQLPPAKSTPPARPAPRLLAMLLFVGLLTVAGYAWTLRAQVLELQVETSSHRAERDDDLFLMAQLVTISTKLQAANSLSAKDKDDEAYCGWSRGGSFHSWKGDKRQECDEAAQSLAAPLPTSKALINLCGEATEHQDMAATEGQGNEEIEVIDMDDCGSVPTSTALINPCEEATGREDKATMEEQGEEVIEVIDMDDCGSVHSRR